MDEMLTLLLEGKEYILKEGYTDTQWFMCLDVWDQIEAADLLMHDITPEEYFYTFSISGKN